MDRQIIIIIINVMAGHNILRTVVKRLSYEDSSDDECERWHQEANMLQVRLLDRDLNHVVRVRNYVTMTIPNYTERQFREHFRMSRRTFENLEQILTPYLIRITETGRNTLNVRTQLLAVLWILATPDSFR